jgi:hypothetical protein
MIAQGGAPGRVSDGFERAQLAAKLRSPSPYKSEVNASRVGHIPALAFTASTKQTSRQFRVRLMKRQEVAAFSAAEERARA